jgi:hypothetical protein
MSAQQIIQIIFVALVFVVPAIIRMVKAASEAKERRRIEQIRQQQIHEAMRTGRPIEEAMISTAPAMPPPSSPQGAQERLRELAARRQAQIEALRRQRAQQAGPGGQPATGRPPTMYQHGPAGAGTSTQPQPAPQRQQQQQQKQPRAQRSQRRSQQQRPQITQEFPAPTAAIGGTSHDHDGDVTHRLVPDSTEVSMTSPLQTARPVTNTDARPTVSLSELRRAMVLREVLGRPVALREPGMPE